MKRTFALACLAAAVGCALAAQRANAQAPSVGAAQKMFDEANSRAADLAKSILGGKGESPAEDRQALGERLRPVVEESFNARQQLQHAKLESLRRWLDEIEKSIKEREENKEAIIKSRIEELLLPKTEDQEKHNSTYKNFFRDAENVRPTAENRQPMVVPQPGPPENVPPGMEVRERYVEEQAEVNGQTDTIRRPFYEIVKIGQPNSARHDGDDNDGYVASPLKSDDQSMTNHGAASPRDAFDFAVRERLAQLDAEAAEEDRKAAEQYLAGLRQHKGVITAGTLKETENKLRQAERALKRAKATLEALALERTELAADAEADVIEAEVEVKRAEAKVEAARASAATALTQIKTLEAEVETAQANLNSQKKSYERMYRLATEEKAVDMKLVDEKQEKLHAAEGSLTAAQGAVLTGKARATQCEADVLAAEAELNVAQTRRHAAQRRRERLMHRAATDPVGAHPSQGDLTQPPDGAKP